MTPNRIDFDCYLITDRHLVPSGRTLLQTIEITLAAGVRAVQLREKDMSAAELLPLARQLRELTRRYRAKLFINDRVDLALAVAADGVHLGGHSLPVDIVRHLAGPDLLIGVSTHRHEEISRAAEQGADFVTFGPVFITPSKVAYGEPRGIENLAEACRLSPLPVFALGGITVETAPAARQAGAHGIALISAVIAAADPDRAVRKLQT